MTIHPGENGVEDLVTINNERELQGASSRPMSELFNFNGRCTHQSAPLRMKTLSLRHGDSIYGIQEPEHGEEETELSVPRQLVPKSRRVPRIHLLARS